MKIISRATSAPALHTALWLLKSSTLTAPFESSKPNSNFNARRVVRQSFCLAKGEYHRSLFRKKSLTDNNPMLLKDFEPFFA